MQYYNTYLKPQKSRNNNSPVMDLNIKNFYSKAEHLFNQNQWKAAQKVLQEALIKQEKTAKIYHLLGLTLYYQENFKLSLQSFQKACEIENKPEYLLNFSIVLNELAFYKKAAKIYKQVLYIDHQKKKQNWKKEIAKNHCQTADTYLKKQEWKLATLEYIKSSQFDSNPIVQLKIVSLLWKLKHKSLAEKQLRKFISIYPKNIKARLLLAEWSFKEKHIAQAVNEWENVLKLHPENLKAKQCLFNIQKSMSLF